MSTPTRDALAQLLTNLASGGVVTLTLGDTELSLRVTMSSVKPAENPLTTSQPGPAAHSPDFASVRWFGSSYTFSQQQRAVIAVLWTAWENGTPDVHGRTLLSEADSYAEDVRDMFRTHPAWGSMLQRSSKFGGQVGCFRLVAPNDSPALLPMFTNGTH